MKSNNNIFYINTFKRILNYYIKATLKMGIITIDYYSPYNFLLFGLFQKN